VIIRIERSGGLAGLSVSKKMDSKDLPATLILKARKIMMDRKLSELPLKSMTKDGADYYSYKIWIQDGDERKVIECNEFNIGDDLKSIVKYVEKS
jgi:hypothetical protein